VSGSGDVVLLGSLDLEFAGKRLPSVYHWSVAAQVAGAVRPPLLWEQEVLVTDGATCGLSTALASVGRFDEALEHLAVALKLPGNAAETHRILGICMFGKRRFAEALENFRRSYDLQSTSSAALMLAHLYSGRDNPSFRDGALAVRFAQEALRVIPDPDGKALLVVAAAYAANSEMDEAVRYADRALEQGRRTADGLIIREAEKRRRAYKGLPDEAIPAVQEKTKDQ
jgi:tetratricopeptide (TPR) repeat protein